MWVKITPILLLQSGSYYNSSGGVNFTPQGVKLKISHQMELIQLQYMSQNNSEILTPRKGVILTPFLRVKITP